MATPYWVYVVRCRDGSLYTGLAKNVIDRVARHNLGRGAKYTRSRRPVTLEFCLLLTSRWGAATLERCIKRLPHVSKERFIRGFVA